MYAAVVRYCFGEGMLWHLLPLSCMCAFSLGLFAQISVLLQNWDYKVEVWGAGWRHMWCSGMQRWAHSPADTSFTRTRLWTQDFNKGTELALVYMK